MLALPGNRSVPLYEEGHGARDKQADEQAERAHQEEAGTEIDMKAPIYLASAIAAIALAGCTQQRPAERPAVSPAAKIVGEPVNCITLRSFNTTRIRDDWTIDFIRGAGNKAWRNTLPHRCPGLRSEDAFSYETSLTQLCNTDIIHVLYRSGGSLQRGAGCGLGQFVPVELEKN
jgi:hypothetical protein